MQIACAPVAQPDRVPGFEPGSRGFESLRARQVKEVLGKLLPLPLGLLVPAPYRIFEERLIAPEMLFGYGIVAKKKLKDLKVG
jgi:hypothetical protein